jgi:hypothetical protein
MKTTPCKYSVNDRVSAVLGGRRFYGVITEIGKTHFRVMPEEGQYFTDATNRRELSVPRSHSANYSANDRIIDLA